VKKESKTLNYYNAIAKGYKNLYHEEQILKINKIKQFLPEKGTILDLGSGDGILNQFLNKEIKIISFDLSFELLKINKNKNKIQGSILNIPFKNESFKYISSFTVFQDIPDKKKAIQETKRILKKEGILILSFLHLTKGIDILIKEIKSNFRIIEEIKEEKDYIFILQKK
jgi:ubiquinone/menaquinone biosynthesis C-methylase UbiE